MSFLGVDIGGTKTHLRLIDGDRMLGERIVASRGWRRREWIEDASSLMQLIDDLVAAHAETPVAALAVGAHGCDDADQCEAFRRALQQLADYPVRVVNDSELIPVALGIFDGIGLVSGTGSIAVTRGKQGEMLVAGGWGWVIGDEGSASGLVRESGRLVSFHLDCGTCLDDPLMRCLQESFAIAGNLTPAHIGHAIHTSGDAATLGRHAPALFAAAEQGSQLARKILDEGAMALVMLVKRLVKRGATARHVVAAGGVITSQASFSKLFLHHFNHCFKGRIQAHILDCPPVTGACIMAHKMPLNHSSHEGAKI